MKLLIADEIGFCAGVKRAIDIARTALSKYNKVYCYGQIIHNTRVISELERAGLVTVNTIDEIENGSPVIIRSHGAPPSEIAEIRAKGCIVIDATCPSVGAIHKKVSSFSGEKSFVFILGKAGHPEVIGIRGCCSASAVIEDVNEFFFPEGYDKFLVVAQTTFDCEKYDAITKKIEEITLNNFKLVEINKTICYTTRDRQNSARKIASTADVMFIIGDKHSSNTKALYDISTQICSRTYLVSNAHDAKTISTRCRISTLGICASASTPEELIMEVINVMNQENNTNNVKENEFVTVEANVATTESQTVSDTVPEERAEQKADVIQDTQSDSSVSDATVTSEETKVVSASDTQEVIPTSEKAESAAVDSSEKPVKDDTDPQKEAPKSTATKVGKPRLKNEFEQYMDERYRPTKQLREGMRVKAYVVSCDQTGVTVSLGSDYGKSDIGFIDKTEMELDGSYNPDDYSVGMEIDATVIPKTDTKIKGTTLSKKISDSLKIEDEAVKRILAGEEFYFACHEVTKGGLRGRLGSYTIFVPASQIRTGYVNNLEDYVDKKLRLRILPEREEPEVNPEDVENTAEGETPPVKLRKRGSAKRIVASQRVIIEEEKQAREDAFWEVMQVNNIIEGRVKRFTDFGAFVAIMGHDCLVHVSDVAWNKVRHPSEVLEIGKTYSFLVLKTDRETERVSLGYKQLQKKPSEIAQEKFKVGDIVKGKVVRVKDFGAFVNIADGIDGLVHISELGRSWVSNPADFIKPGEEVEVKILMLAGDRITLSIKAAMEANEPPEEFVADDDSKERSATSGLKRFNNKFDRSDNNRSDRGDKRNKRNDQQRSDEHREHHSAPGRSATFGDLFKHIDINKFDDDNK
ncbi:MAG: 4-hydroxy-3-methylbut-2-enyl diphosphate reductase [Christensenellaceae bacterium]|jgi:4-hydroxy-3-methylbut-2-enyl diphosphate reductase|nr:4-hydroxy-3-methylbut-2-enyl diphosphate reductase [Christensenellaceae bacterium]